MRKKNSNAFSHNGITGSLFFVVETSIFASVFFFALNGFKLSINSTVLVYSIIYSIIVIATLITNIFIYKLAEFAFASLLLSTFSLLLSLASGYLFFKEPVTYPKLISIGLMIIASIVIFLGSRTQKVTAGQNNKRSSIRKLYSVSLILLNACIGALGTVILKKYSFEPYSTDNNSFFFVTNIFCCLIALLTVTFTMHVDKVSFKILFSFLKGKKTVMTAITTVNSNVMSIIGLLLLGMMDVSVYTPLHSAMIYASTIFSVPILGEKLNRYTVIASAIAILSVILPAVLF